MGLESLLHGKLVHSEPLPGLQPPILALAVGRELGRLLLQLGARTCTTCLSLVGLDGLCRGIASGLVLMLGLGRHVGGLLLLLLVGDGGAVGRLL